MLRDLLEPREIGIIGLGHIGASVAAALRGKADVRGFDVSSENLAYAADKVQVRIADSIAEIALSCEIIVLATPTPSVDDILSELDRTAYAAAVSPVVVDVASVKSALAGPRSSHSAIRFVSLHPMAGREGNGPESYDPRIFEQARWAIPLAGNEDPAAVLTAMSLPVRLLGNPVVPLYLDQHDSVIALISTLPHVTALALTRALARSSHAKIAKWLAAGSYRDGTRVAKTDSDRLLEMLWPNRVELQVELRRLVNDLELLSRRLLDMDGLRDWIVEGHGAAALLDVDHTDVESVAVKIANIVPFLLEHGEYGAIVVGIRRLNQESVVVRLVHS